MRGPHNIFRLIRTGATFERTGAMNVILNAYQAPVGLRLAAKILGWPFQWLGYKGDPAMPPVTRADRFGSSLYQIRANPIDPPRCGWR
jgi:ubiquinone biosynthesis protein